ncbi:hypothetical protein AVMA1855_23110 [Acidovorax sp. SUPP1855]|uniref:hemagglutinin repeat-containing protein n=1 Tax=Acidovorax sp. SUPP1855 TaxID=431774 RepID=UPI0023DE44D5|nr:hemagglutinin repeat-containing protein [Acidovorax sp. SUPP1855]GKS87096.1 hypothetical protein AVMA1855_23110 [Acidovorax sp. SUPP1855]
MPPEFVNTKPLALPRVDVSTPQGGIGALLGGGASVALPDWSQLHIVPGGISANDLALNLNGQFINRGQFEVGNSLIIAAAGGIDNFGAGIQAGGVMRLSGGGLNNEQGRIEAGSLLTSIQGDIANSRGTIVAHNGGYLQADGSIAATDGQFTSDAGRIALDAGGNIVLDASRVSGKTGAGLYASGDIRLGTTAKTTSSDERSAQYQTFVTYNGDMETREETRVQTGESRTRQSSTVHTGTVIDGGEGSTTVRAKGDVVALGAQIKAQQDVLIQGANVRVEAVKDSAFSHEEEHRKGYDHALIQRQETLSGGEISAGRNLSIVANGKADAGKAEAGQGDITLRGATVTAKGDVSLIASRDVQVQDLQTEHGRYEETYSKKSGFLSKKSTLTVQEGASLLSEGSVVTGNAIYVQAGRDIGVQGSHLVGQADVGLIAGRDIAIRAGTDTASAMTHTETKKSGLFSGGGFGITLGKQSTTTDHRNESQRAAASSVQSQGGNVALVAGNRYEQEGSAVLAKGDVSIVGRAVDIHESRELERDLFETRAKQSGLTVTISNPVVSAVQGAQTVTRIAGAMGKTSDTRMQALGLAAAGMAASETYGQVSELIKDPGKAGSVGFNISVGSSQSRSTNAYQVDSAAGSQIKADGNVRITATQGDLRVRGSDIEAGKDVGLVAEKGNIVLEAAQNRFAEQNSSSSSSASVGIGINVGAQSGVSFNAGVSQSRGQGSGESVSYTNTHIRANGTASVQSAGDTTLRGATIVADAVRADVGGNLTIESLQDVSRYNEASRSAGLSVSVCVPPLCYGASSVGGSVGRTRIDSDYQSVGEQSGIRAGNGGFDVNVKGNTDLKGGAITSTQAAIDGGKNTFTTGGTLTQSDIENHAAYSASGFNVSGSVGFQMGDQGSAQTPEDRNAAANDKGKPGGSAGVGSDKGSAGSTTRSGISGVSGNTEARTGDAETGIKPIFDKGRVRDEVNAQITITAEFGARASKAVGDYADRKLQEAMNSGDQAEIDNWKEGGAGRVAMHALVGAAGGGLAGAVGAGMSQVAVAHLDSTLRELGVDDGVRQVLVGAAGTAVGAAVGGRAGAAASTNATLNNFLNHQELSERANKQSACQNGDAGACSRVRELDTLSAQRNEVIRDGITTMTTDQGLQVQQDLATVMVGLYDYKNQLQQELGATSDPSRRAELSNQGTSQNPCLSHLARLQITSYGVQALQIRKF